MVSFTKGTFKEIVNRRLLKENDKLNKIAEANIGKAKESRYVLEIRKILVEIKELDKAVKLAREELNKTIQKADRVFPMVSFRENSKGELVVEKIKAQLSYDNSYGENVRNDYGCGGGEYLTKEIKEISYDVSQFKLVMEIYGKDEIAKAIRDFIAGKKVEL